MTMSRPARLFFPRIGEHRVGLADAGTGAEEDLQLPALRLDFLALHAREQGIGVGAVFGHLRLRDTRRLSDGIHYSGAGHSRVPPTLGCSAKALIFIISASHRVAQTTWTRERKRMSSTGCVFRFPAQVLLFLVGLASFAARAVHPLITEDTGTQGQGGWQLEVNAEKTRDRDGRRDDTRLSAGCDA